MTSVEGWGGAIRLSLSGELLNNCTDAAAAPIRIDARNDEGKVIQSKEG